LPRVWPTGFVQVSHTLRTGGWAHRCELVVIFSLEWNISVPLFAVNNHISLNKDRGNSMPSYLNRRAREITCRRDAIYFGGDITYSLRTWIADSNVHKVEIQWKDKHASSTTVLHVYSCVWARLSVREWLPTTDMTGTNRQDWNRPAAVAGTQFCQLCPASMTAAAVRWIPSAPAGFVAGELK
jgi:hypothetical protein